MHYYMLMDASWCLKSFLHPDRIASPGQWPDPPGIVSRSPEVQLAPIHLHLTVVRLLPTVKSLEAIHPWRHREGSIVGLLTEYIHLFRFYRFGLVSPSNLILLR